MTLPDLIAQVIGYFIMAAFFWTAAVMAVAAVYVTAANMVQKTLAALRAKGGENGNS